MTGCQSLRTASLGLSQKIAIASLQLEHLAASFVVDASQFFHIHRPWAWPNLCSLVLTSHLLTPDTSPLVIEEMLQAAAAACLKMPQLQALEICNGRKRLAALFKYEAFRKKEEARITCKGTWKLTMTANLIQAWEDVSRKFHSRTLHVKQEELSESYIRSHGDAIRYLEFFGQIIRSVSLQQIETEQRAFRGLRTVG